MLLNLAVFLPIFRECQFYIIEKEVEVYVFLLTLSLFEGMIVYEAKSYKFSTSDSDYNFLY